MVQATGSPKVRHHPCHPVHEGDPHSCFAGAGFTFAAEGPFRHRRPARTPLGRMKPAVVAHSSSVSQGSDSGARRLHSVFSLRPQHNLQASCRDLGRRVLERQRICEGAHLRARRVVQGYIMLLALMLVSFQTWDRWTIVIVGCTVVTRDIGFGTTETIVPEKKRTLTWPVEGVAGSRTLASSFGSGPDQEHWLFMLCPSSQQVHLRCTRIQHRPSAGLHSLSGVFPRCSGSETPHSSHLCPHEELRRLPDYPVQKPQETCQMPHTISVLPLLAGVYRSSSPLSIYDPRRIGLVVVPSSCGDLASSIPRGTTPRSWRLWRRPRGRLKESI